MFVHTLFLMIDVVQFRVDMNIPWVKRLGFRQFVHYKEIGGVIGGDEDAHLRAVRNSHVRVLLCPELVKGRDHLHWRNAGLTSQILQLAQKHGIAIGFCFSSVLEREGVERSQVLGRMMQNVRLCRKYRVGMVLCSFACDIYGLRSASDLQSFGRILGMTPGEAKQALGFSLRERGVRVLS